jgi:phosphoglycolate phosphatase-like HAD superfamily hydrolase
MSAELLPSWRPGPTKDAVVDFLAGAESLPVEQRLAVFDNDGTLWCERPAYVQYEFFVHALRRAVQSDPVLAYRDEFAAVLDDDTVAIGELGLARVAIALTGLFHGQTPEAFTVAAREFLATSRHSTFGRPLADMRYLPMLELIGELRRRDFAVAIVSGGGTEFVRAISRQLYGVPPELVVGTLIGYRVDRDELGSIIMRRTGAIAGPANEAQAKVVAIQSCLGRRPVFAAGNSAGDREMLEWATSGEGPSLALLVDHDDEAREFRYQSISGTLEESEPITDIGRRLGWTTVSMERDWAEVFGGRAVEPDQDATRH